MRQGSVVLPGAGAGLRRAEGGGPGASPSSAGLHQNSTSGRWKLLDCGENVRVNVIINEEISRYTDQYLPGCEHPDKLDDEEDPELELAVSPDHAGQLVPVRGLLNHADDLVSVWSLGNINLLSNLVTKCLFG